MKRLLYILCVVLGLMFSQAAAKDVYVRTGGDVGDGSKAKPYKYLWKAVDKALRGDVIHVAAGTYEGKNGCGHFSVKTPDLTLAGGYNADFSQRDPFKHRVLLRRAKDYKGDWTGLPEGIIAGVSRSDHSNLIIDGFWLNGRSRNKYKATGDIFPKGCYRGELIEASARNIRIRNCVLLNPYGDGIYCTWQDKGNEISNCFIINTFHAAISTRSNQPDSAIRIKNCTILFCWFQPGKGGGLGIVIGNQGAVTIEDNIIAFIQTEGSGAGNAVINGFGNEDTVMKDNIFFQCQGGYYKYMDADKKNLLVWKADELKELNEDAESFMLAKAGGNTDADPKCKPDKDYFEKFSNSVASRPGKLNMDMMNQWRRSVGLPLQAEKGSARKNWGMAYSIDAVIPNLVSGVKGRGVQVAGPFEKYASKAAAVEKKDYAAVEFDSFKKGAEGVKQLKGKAVTFQALLGPAKPSFMLKNAPRSEYVCYVLAKPGVNPSATRDFVYGYILKGSAAHKKWTKLSKKAARHNKKGGIVIKGAASYLGSDAYSYPVGVIVDEVNRK